MAEPMHPHIEALEAAAFRHLVEHLRQRADVSNIDLMGHAGFCRNCLADWLMEASVLTPAPITREEARHHIYGESYADFKARQLDADPEAIERMNRSLAENDRVRRLSQSRELDDELDDSFPASDPPGIVHHG